MVQIRKATTLDGGDFGWLKARHHFKVTPEGNPANRPLGSLVVWNDDEIAPGRGFDLHGHADMEIITYVRRGTVTHRDSIGNVGLTRAGDVQAISAGTGIRHSEFNLGQEPLKLFQIWLRPRQTGTLVASPKRIGPISSSSWRAAFQSMWMPCVSAPIHACSAPRCSRALS
jgi:quercetin 2,3-dioxygenase